MTPRRRIELSLAAVIAGSAIFSSFVPGASSSDVGLDGARLEQSASNLRQSLPELSTPTLSQFSDLRLSDAARAVASSVSGDTPISQRFAAPAPTLNPTRGLQRGNVQLTPVAASQSGPAWSGRALGFEFAAAPQTGDGVANWWLVGGAGQESYAVAPAGLREFTVAPVAAETTIGDAHMGVGLRVSDNAYASVGYVREQRKFVLGTEDWEEDEHYLGVGFQARW